MDNNKIGIGIATYNQQGKIKDLVESMNCDYDIYVINTHPEIKMQDTSYLNNFRDIGRNLGCSGSWNYLINWMIEEGKEYFIIANDDIVCRHDTISNLVRMVGMRPNGSIYLSCVITDKQMSLEEFGRLGSDGWHDIRFEPCYSLFLLPKSTVDKVGVFDVQIYPIYCEDTEWDLRMMYHGLDRVVAATSLFYHYGSSTIKTDSGLMQEVKGSAQRRNFLYVLQKYGITEHDYNSNKLEDRVRGARLKKENKKRGE